MKTKKGSIKKSYNSSLILIKKEIIQIRLLFKHFLLRFIKNDSQQHDDQRTDFMIFALVFTGIWGGYIADKVEKHFYLSIVMIVTGVITILLWDLLLPDRKDYMNLTTLPVKNRTIYLAKFLSSLTMVGAISGALSLVSALQFTFRFGSGGLDALVIYFLSLFLINFLASWFVFSIVVGLQSIILILFRGKWVDRVALWVQVTGLGGLAASFVWFFRMKIENPGLSDTFSNIHYYMPALWFNGLHEWVTGNNALIHEFHFHLAVVGLLVPSVLYIFALPLSLRYSLKVNSGSISLLSQWTARPLGLMKQMTNTLFLRNPVERAVFYFFIGVFKRSKKQKIRLTMFMALPVGFILIHLIYLYQAVGPGNFQNFNLIQLIFPFLLYFVLIAGLRSVVGIPVTLEANWIFKLTAESNSISYYRGMQKAMLVYTILPVTGIVFVFYMLSWDFTSACLYTSYSLSLALLLQEVFFFNYRYIPFTTEYSSSSFNIKTAWPFLAILFMLYNFLFLQFGLWLMLVPTVKYFYYPCILLTLGWFRWYRNQEGKKGLVFKEDPPPAMLSLQFESN